MTVSFFFLGSFSGGMIISMYLPLSSLFLFIYIYFYFFQIIFLAAEAKKHIRLSLLLKGLASSSFVALGIYCMQKTGNRMFAGFVVSWATSGLAGLKR